MYTDTAGEFLSDFKLASFGQLGGGGPGATVQVSIEGVSIATQAVPEPGGATCFAFLVLGIGALTWYRGRQSFEGASDFG